jgi:hypothetical protein
MIGEVVPPGWLLRPQSWPYWMPNTLLGQLPPLGLPDDGAERSSASNRQQFSGPNAAAANLPGVRAANAPTWLEPAASSPSSDGILGSLTRNLSGDSQPLFSGGVGILVPLGRASGVREESAPAWLQSVTQWSPRSDQQHGTRGRRQSQSLRKVAEILLSRKTLLPQRWVKSYPTPM